MGKARTRRPSPSGLAAFGRPLPPSSNPSPRPTSRGRCRRNDSRASTPRCGPPAAASQSRLAVGERAKSPLGVWASPAAARSSRRSGERHVSRWLWHAWPRSSMIRERFRPRRQGRLRETLSGLSSPQPSPTRYRDVRRIRLQLADLLCGKALSQALSRAACIGQAGNGQLPAVPTGKRSQETKAEVSPSPRPSPSIGSWTCGAAFGDARRGPLDRPQVRRPTTSATGRRGGGGVFELALRDSSP